VKVKDKINQYIRTKIGTGRIENPADSNMTKDIIENIDTKTGDEILTALRDDKWKLVSQYYILAFDKGIDFDYYRLKKNGQELYFEWDNWFEWKIFGSQQMLKQLVSDYSLKLEIKPMKTS